ncbi:hypothetical protein LINPERPRIM_LOCUS15820 [Linum perenne]
MRRSLRNSSTSPRELGVFRLNSFIGKRTIWRIS